VASLLGAAGQRLAGAVLGRPILTLGLSLLVAVGALYLTTTLTFDSSFAALLPPDAEEVREVRELQRLAGGTTELVVAVGGEDPERRLEYARKVVGHLRKDPAVQRADVEFPVDFFRDRRLLLLPLKTLRKLKGAMDEEIEAAKARANPLYVDLEDDEEQGGPWSRVEAIEQEAGLSGLARETYKSPDGRYLFVRVRPRGTSSDMAQGKVVLASLKAAVTGAGQVPEGLEVRLAGALVVNQEQNDRMDQDMRRASLVALALVVLLMTVYVRRLAAPIIIAAPLILGVLSTLAVIALTLGQLNLITGFLVSALFGLGVDFEIHLYLRYLEFLRAGARSRRDAMSRAVARTLPGCATAAATTAAAFFAVSVSDFRGFREYGMMAGAGVLITLAATYIALPPLAVLITRRGRPRSDASLAAMAATARAVGRRNFGRGMAWTVVLLAGVGLLGSLARADDVRWHSDFYKLRGTSKSVAFNEWVAGILGGTLSPAAILVQDLDQARRVEEHLAPLVGDPRSQFKSTLSLASLVPADAANKLAVMGQIRASLQQVDPEDLDDADRERLEDALKLTGATTWTVDEIPEVFRNRFLTADGKGQFVIVWPRSAMYAEDEIIAWGDALNKVRRELRAAGIPVKIMDENRLGARVLKKMRTDAPVMLGAAATAVFVLLLVGFGRFWPAALVMGTLAVGVSWMLGYMTVIDLEINVFNQAILASVIGMGIDNAVHIFNRYREEGEGHLSRVISTTGSASLLATATTAIGFGAAISAHHYGVRSLGWLAVVGLSCTFIASTLFFPSVLRLLERRKSGAQANVECPVPSPKGGAQP